MSKQDDNKAVVGRWFTEFWGKDVNLAVVDDIAAPDMLLKYSLHAPRRGRGDIKAFMTDFPRRVPRPQLLGDRGSHRRRRLCRRAVGRRRNPHRSCLQRLSGRKPVRRHRPQDALHGHDGPEGDRRQNCGGDRPRRRRHRADPARPAQGRLIERRPQPNGETSKRPAGLSSERQSWLPGLCRSSRRRTGSCC